MRKLRRERQDSGGTVQDLLQLVGVRLADSAEESVAAVDARCYEGMDESLRGLLGQQHTADPTDVAQVDIRTTADAVNLGPHVQVFVENNAQVSHLISGRKETLNSLVGGIRVSRTRMPGMVNFSSC